MKERMSRLRHPCLNQRFLQSALLLIIFALSLPAADTANALSLHPANPHYFLFRGRPAILISSGEHYGAVLNLDFDYMAYLNELHSKKLNHTRLFSGTYREVETSFGITGNTLAPKPNRYLAPWARSSTPGYVDGGNKFNLTKWNPDFFRRLENFIREAGRREIVVEISLFCPLYDERLWEVNPMNARNNVNGIGESKRDEVFALKYRDLTEVQKAFTRKVVTELSGFDNVYLEVCNEPWMGGVTSEWQNEIIAALADAQSSLAGKLLISQNPLGPKIKNPNPAVSIFNFHQADSSEPVRQNYALNKVIGDNETGFRGLNNLAYRTEAWDCIIGGGAIFSSLDYSFTTKHPDGSFLDYKSPGGGNAELRKQLRVLKEFVHGFDFVRMAPTDSVVTKSQPEGLVVNRVLAEAVRAYAVYLRRRTDADRFSVRWTGLITPAETEDYTFQVQSNVGVRLWVNDKLVIDNNRAHPKTENLAVITLAAGLKSSIRMECYQAGNDAAARLSCSNSTVKKLLVLSSQVTPPDGIGQGFKAEYFEDRGLKKCILARNDSAIDFAGDMARAFPKSKTAESAELTLELPAGNYLAEWMISTTGNVVRREKFQHAGGSKKISSPAFSEDAVLRLVSGKKR